MLCVHRVESYSLACSARERERERERERDLSTVQSWKLAVGVSKKN